MEESQNLYSYNPFNSNEISNFQISINFLMEKADEFLGFNHKNKDGVLYRNLLNSEKKIDVIDKYKSEVYSNMALATTRLRAIFELIDIEMSQNSIEENDFDKINDDQSEDFLLKEDDINERKMKEEIYKNFQELMKFFNDALNVTHIDRENFDNKTKELSKIHFKFNTEIYKILKKNDIHNNLKRKIDILNGLQNMFFEKKTIVTNIEMFKDGKKYKRIITDIPINPISNEIKEKIKNNDYKNDFWYKSLTEFQKNVFEGYKDQIISDHPIPNMINFIPGIRNAFERTDKILDENNNEIAKTSIIHTAHPTVIKNKDSKNLTKENVEHLQRISRKRIFLSGLITPLIFNFGEKKMHKELRDTVIKFRNLSLFEKIKERFLNLTKKSNRYLDSKSQRDSFDKNNLISYGNVPINMFRILCLCLFKKRSMNNLIKESLISIIKHNKLNSFIDENADFQELIKILDSKNVNIDEQSQKIFQTIKFLNKNLNDLSRLEIINEQLKGKNLSLEINANFHDLIDMMSEFNKENSLYKDSISVLFCKSGKDRTGIQQEYSMAKILSNKQNIFSENDLLKSSIESFHLRFMNGSQYGGNSVGLNGVLGRPMNVDSKDYKIFKENLYTNVAESNHFKYQKKNFIMKFIDCVEIFFKKIINR